MSRVLVSGAGGFVGLPLLAQLAGTDLEIHALSTRGHAPAPPGVCWHHLDLSDRAAVSELIDELAPERLVHLAWCTEHGRFWSAPENVTWVELSLHLLRAFVRRGGQRAVMIGTCAEYDWSTACEPLVESRARLAPATLYGAAKDALRRVGSAYAEQEGVELAWGRLFFLYGPREAPARLVPSVIRSLMAGKPVSTRSTEHVRDFMHVEDVAGAVVALLRSPVIGAVNIASGVGVTVGHVVDQIAQLLGRQELVGPRSQADGSGEPPLLVADVARLHDEVGFQPRWELADGLAATVNWWADHGDGEPVRDALVERSG